MFRAEVVILERQDLPSPDWWAEHIKRKNDGSLPLEAYHRVSQAIFEAWLKRIIQQESGICSYWGLKFESLVEYEDSVESVLSDSSTGTSLKVRSQYVVGCDGAGSRVRRSIDKRLIGGPV